VLCVVSSLMPCTDLQDVSCNSNETVEQLSSEIDSIGSSLGEDIDEVVWSFSNGVRSLDNL